MFKASKRTKLKHVGDILLVVSLLVLFYSYLIPDELAIAIQFVNTSILLIGGIAMAIHFCWMLYEVWRFDDLEYKWFWFLVVLLLYILGSALFYIKVFRPRLEDNS